jgi:hypothetical protein
VIDCSGDSTVSSSSNSPKDRSSLPAGASIETGHLGERNSCFTFLEHRPQYSVTSQEVGVRPSSLPRRRDALLNRV